MMRLFLAGVDKCVWPGCYVLAWRRQGESWAG